MPYTICCKPWSNFCRAGANRCFLEVLLIIDACGYVTLGEALFLSF
jgi:hypothetical protein